VELDRGGGRREIHATLWPGAASSASAGEQARSLELQVAALLGTAGARNAGMLIGTSFETGSGLDAGAAMLPSAAGCRWSAAMAPGCSRCRVVWQLLLVHGGAAASSGGAGEPFLYAAPISSAGEEQPAYEDFLAAFERARAALESLGADFRRVVRTWIYLRDIRADYADFNRARGDFFARHGVGVFPASTGVGLAAAERGPRCRMAIQAIAPGAGPRIARLSSPSFNEAPDYGSHFSRGLRIDDGERSTLLVSGTAAIDERGASVAGGIEVQAERSLRNLRGLLEGQGLGFQAAVQAVSYLKRAEDAPRYRRVLEAHGVLEIPHAVVLGEICRPELLCEIEMTLIG
jgi:enamine deaminase RidA (YjgF/YER057c/UK114 family)